VSFGLKICLVCTHIRFRSTSKSEITAIIAPNGHGKTVCLKLIEALFAEHYEFFLGVDFSRIVFEFTEGQVVTITKEAREIKPPSKGDRIERDARLFELEDEEDDEDEGEAEAEGEFVLRFELKTREKSESWVAAS
jgi:hypothetical protein